MMEAKGQIDLDQMFSYCDDLGAVFRDDKDVSSLADLLRGADSLRDSSVAHLGWLSSSIQVIASEIKYLDQQRASIEERKCALKKLEKQELRERMMLSIYASITTVIPIHTDDSNVSAYVVDRKKSVVDRFQFGSASTDTCESIWRMIDEREDRRK